MEKDNCGDETQEKHNCCSNKYLKVITDNHFTKVAFEFDFQGDWVFIPSEVFVVYEIAPIAQKIPTQNPYRPPPLIEDLQIRYETFLI